MTIEILRDVRDGVASEKSDGQARDAVRLSEKSMSAASLWKAVQERPIFTTGSEDLDDLMAQTCKGSAQQRQEPLVGQRGLSAGNVIEMAGPPGIGKTAVCISMAVEARLRTDLDIEVLMIDTEGSIMPKIIRSRLRDRLSALPDQERERSVKSAQDGIYLTRPTSMVSLLALIHQLENWLKIHPKVQLILIDTISYHFRHPVTKPSNTPPKSPGSRGLTDGRACSSPRHNGKYLTTETAAPDTASKPPVSPSSRCLVVRRKEVLNPHQTRDYHLKFVSGILRTLSKQSSPNLAILCTSQLATRFYTADSDRFGPTDSTYRVGAATMAESSRALLQPQLGRSWNEKLDGRLLTWFDHDGSRQVGTNRCGTDWTTRAWMIPSR